MLETWEVFQSGMATVSAGLSIGLEQGPPGQTLSRSEVPPSGLRQAS
jgi:hypothetical protein